MKIGEKIVKIITKVLMIIVVVAIFFALYNFISLKVLKKEYVNYFGYTIFDVISGSMEGTIEIGDVIVVDVNTTYKVNDIVTYRSNNDYVTHRIIDMEDGVIITKGDANNTADQPIDAKLIIGKVVKILPRLGIWKDVIITPKVLGSILVTLLLFSLAFSYSTKDGFAKILKKDGNVAEVTKEELKSQIANKYKIKTNETNNDLPKMK